MRKPKMHLVYDIWWWYIKILQRIGRWADNKVIEHCIKHKILFGEYFTVPKGWKVKYIGRVPLHERYGDSEYNIIVGWKCFINGPRGSVVKPEVVVRSIK